MDSTWLQAGLSAGSVAPAGGERRALNVADIIIRGVDRSLRSMGFCGFETQMFAAFSGRIDAAALQHALLGLGRRFPLLTARLLDADSAARPCWHSRANANVALQRVDLDSDEQQAVLEHAARLLAAAPDPTQADPMRFYLLRRPGGRDLLLVQYNHTLLDNNAALQVVSEIERCHRGLAPQSADLPAGRRDTLRRYLRRFPAARRRAAVSRALGLWRHELRGGAVSLGRFELPRTSPADYRILTRRLDETQTRAVEEAAVRACGYRGLSMALLASVFRVLERMAPAATAARRQFIAGIGLDLGLRRRGGPLFGNLMSLAPVYAAAGELADRDALVRSLSHQLRRCLKDDVDLGLLQLMSIFSRRPRHAGWAVEHLLRHGFSVWYGYFGSLDAVGPSLCGTAIEELLYAGPSWSPVGLTLIANQFRGQLCLQATCLCECIPASLVHDLLDQVVADLSP